MSTDLLGLLATNTADLLSPLQRAVEVPGGLRDILALLGAPPTNDNAGVTAVIQAGVDVKTQIESLAANESPSLDDILGVLGASQRAFDALRALDASGGPVAQLPGFGADLVELLVSSWLTARHPVLHQIATLLTLIELEVDQEFAPTQMQGTDVARYPYRMERIRLNRLGPLLRDPVGVLREAYVTPLMTGADADAMADALFPKVVGLLRELGVSCRYGVNEGDEAMLGDSAPFMNHALIIYLNDPLHDLELEAGIVLSISSADRGDLGLVVSPFGTLTATRFFGSLGIDLSLTAGVDAIAFGRHGLTLLASTAATDVSGSISAEVGKPKTGPAFVIGSPTGTRLEIGGARMAAEMSLSDAKQRLAVSADITSSALVIPKKDNDGFIADILPADGIRVPFDLGIGWASDTGVTLRGSAGLDADVAVGLSLGPVTLSSLHLALKAQLDGGITTEVSANLGAAIGPLRASVERLGLSAALTFPAKGGNLGVADLAFGIKPPSGVGLAIEAQGVLTGGGFLFFDSARGLYAGVLQLSLHDRITLTAYGLITTQMPDGRPGYSVLIFITADGFQPIPLGFGLVLQSLGGMVGIHRTFDQAVLTAGLKADTLSTLLFPRDPVGNAPALLQALGSAFPAQRGHYLLGLLARITWFTPTLVQCDLALILEFGARTRLLMLGRVSALLPTRENDLIRLNMDAIGVLDFDAGTLEADAVLVDSRLVHQFPITGSAALRARWAGDPNFVLAVGGLNPHFAAPAGFPKLERVTIALCSGKNPRLVCDAYLAVTANTMQFGASASLYAEAAGFSITGDVGFDALVTIVPPHFLIDFHAAFQLKRGSHNLFKITIDGTLEGPLPLRIAAKAKFEILWFSFTVHFDFTLTAGDAASAAAAIPAVSLVAEVAKALGDPASWATRVPTTALATATVSSGIAGSVASSVGVALRALSAGAGLVLEPGGQLVVQQQFVPLNSTRDVTTLGGAAIVGDRRVHVAATLNGLASSAAVTGAFAPARYFTMSDDEKLVAPSFETMDAGVVLGDATTQYDVGAITPAVLEYFPITLAPLAPPASTTARALAAPIAPTPAVSAPVRYALQVEGLTRQRPTGAAARGPLRSTGRARFRNSAAVPAATATAPHWRILRVSDGAVAPLDPSTTTWSETRAALATLNRGGARWLMVPAHENPE